MKTLFRAALHVAANALALLLASHHIPGIHVSDDSWSSLLVAGLVLGLVNLLVKPIVTFFSFPFVIVTLGLFYLAINGLMLALGASLLDSVTVDGCLPAILGGVVVAVANWLVGSLFASE
jgi:putative membrane protein